MNNLQHFSNRNRITNHLPHFARRAHVWTDSGVEPEQSHQAQSGGQRSVEKTLVSQILFSFTRSASDDLHLLLGTRGRAVVDRSLELVDQAPRLRHHLVDTDTPQSAVPVIRAGAPLAIPQVVRRGNGPRHAIGILSIQVHVATRRVDRGLVRHHDTLVADATVADASSEVALRGVLDPHRLL